MELNDIRQAIELGVKIGINTYKSLDHPQYISTSSAKKKYRGLLEAWETMGFVKKIPTESGKYVYEAHQLDSLYQQYLFGEQ